MSKREIYLSLCVTNINNYLSQIVLVKVASARSAVSSRGPSGGL